MNVCAISKKELPDEQLVAYHNIKKELLSLIKKDLPTFGEKDFLSLDVINKYRKLHIESLIKKDTKAICKFAMDIGSDVPFFLQAKPAYALGRGEKLTPLPDFKLPGKILLVNPGIHISTPSAFKSLGIKRSKRKLMESIKKFSTDKPELMINDFERVVFKKYPEIEKIKYDMYSFGASYSLMSGSGSTVYGIFSNKDIKTAERYFRLKKYKVFVS